MIKRAKEQILKEFDINKTIKSYFKYYEEILYK
jgi:hypothetical protein